MNSFNGRRIVVIGTSGSGKTTFARRLASKLGFTHVELDELHWEPNWTEAAPAVFEQRVREKLPLESDWIVDGNYSKVRDLIWQRCDTIIWLDFALHTVMWRLFNRTIERLISQKALWNGNREEWRTQFLTKDSIFLWAWTSYPRYKKEYPSLLAQPEYSHTYCLRFSSPQTAEKWLSKLD